MTAILKIMVKGFLVGLAVFGLFAVAAHAQSGETKKFIFKLDKRKALFKTPEFDLPAGKIVIGGDVRGVDVAGGAGGCYTITVTTYRLTPTGEKVPVRSRSRQVCLTDRLPELVIDRIPRGKYLIEIGIDRPLIKEEILQGELAVRIQPEKFR